MSDMTLSGFSCFSGDNSCSSPIENLLVTGFCWSVSLFLVTINQTEKMSEYGSDDGADRPIYVNETNSPRVSDEFKNLLEGSRIPAYKRDPGELNNWLTAIGENCLSPN